MSDLLSVTPPVQEDNLRVVAGTASSQWVTIPDEWREGYITIKAEGDDFHIAFGASGLTVDETATSTMSGNAFTAFDGDEADFLPAKGVLDVDGRKLKKGTVAFAWKGTGTAGYLRITRTSGYA